MKFLGVKDDGTTTVELTDAEAHELRDRLPQIAPNGESPAWQLHRLLSFSHGEPGTED